MNFANPTPLHIGMTGNFSGKHYRVIGRAMLGEMEDTGIYYWNEFNLAGDDGQYFTLVYEDTGRGPEWRWFTMFDPPQPMTAAEAATKRFGDRLDLAGSNVRVTLVRKSHIYLVEGTPPEGEAVGREAHYFNAEAGSIMLVVSWTGEEVEFYRGVTISAGMVASGFNLPRSAFKRFSLRGQNNFAGSNFVVKCVVGLLIFIFVLIGLSAFESPRRPPPVVTYNAPSSPLHVGASGALNGIHYLITGHATVNLAEVGLRFQRHEFQLHDDDGHDALLIFGLEPDTRDWFLFTPLTPSLPLTPQQAGAVHFGQTVNVDGVEALVNELFSSTVLQAENSDAPEMKIGETRYGFSGRSGSTVLLVRWNETAITFHQGKPVLAPDVIAAFGH